MKMGYIFVVSGIVLIVVGIMLLNDKNQQTSNVETSQHKSEIPTVEASTLESQSSTTKGCQFEEYVIEHFKRKYFTLIEWRSDKIHRGVYAESNCYPDMEWQFKLKDESFFFAVECKWRKGFQGNSLSWCEEDQLQNYKRFQEERKVTVFIILGVGGTPSAPEIVYIVPLNSMKYHTVTREYLKQFPSDTDHSNFFFDTHSRILRFPY